MRKGLLAYDVSVTAIAWCAEEVKNTERFPEMDSMGDWSLRGILRRPVTYGTTSGWSRTYITTRQQVCFVSRDGTEGR